MLRRLWWAGGEGVGGAASGVCRMTEPGRCTKEAPQSWVAAYAAMQHVMDCLIDGADEE